MRAKVHLLDCHYHCCCCVSNVQSKAYSLSFYDRLPNPGQWIPTLFPTMFFFSFYHTKNFIIFPFDKMLMNSWWSIHFYFLHTHTFFSVVSRSFSMISCGKTYKVYFRYRGKSANGKRSRNVLTRKFYLFLFCRQWQPTTVADTDDVQMDASCCSLLSGAIKTFTSHYNH